MIYIFDALEQRGEEVPYNLDAMREPYQLIRDSCSELLSVATA